MVGVDNGLLDECLLIGWHPLQEILGKRVRQATDQTTNDLTVDAVVGALLS